MNLTDRFTFGQYKGLRLVDVYQGTSAIDTKLLSDYLEHCFNHNQLPQLTFIQFSQITFDRCQLDVKADIFNEDLPDDETNRICLVDPRNPLGLSKELEDYFNMFFMPEWRKIFTSIAQFNQNEKYHCVIGGNPEYIEWCINTVNRFSIDEETLRELDQLEVHRLIGIKVDRVGESQYLIKPNTLTGKFRFKSVK